jgi:hypothetical protein
MEKWASPARQASNGAKAWPGRWVQPSATTRAAVSSTAARSPATSRGVKSSGST